METSMLSFKELLAYNFPTKCWGLELGCAN
jgi:hypothetical protein